MGRQMRLDQYISTYVEITRKEAKEAIRRGLVCVSGTVVKQANCKIDSEEDVTYCGKEIRAEEFVYYMLNKPAGVVSATKDEKERTVLSLLPEMKRELFPMGRLDKDTVGLLILTDDGMLAHRLLSPSYSPSFNWLISFSVNFRYSPGFKAGSKFIPANDTLANLSPLPPKQQTSALPGETFLPKS